jgi:hypothetical protein
MAGEDWGDGNDAGELLPLATVATAGEGSVEVVNGSIWAAVTDDPGPEGEPSAPKKKV